MFFRILPIFFVGIWLSFMITDIKGCTTWTSNSSESCYVLATCDSSGLAVTIKGSDFPNASPLSAAYIDSGVTPTYKSDCSMNMTGTSAGTEFNNVFAYGLTDCYTDTTSGGTTVGEINTFLYLQYLGPGINSQKDIIVKVKCELKRLDEYDNITTTAASTDFTPKALQMGPIIVGAGWQNVTMSFLYEDETPITFGNSLQINKDTQKMCVRIKASDTDIEDFWIKDFIISETADPTQTSHKIEVITNECTTATSYGAMFEFPALASGGTCTSAFKEQCKNYKMFCYSPFKFSASNNMNYIASLTRLNSSTAGTLKTGCAGIGTIGMGRKKRETDGEDDTAVIKAALTIHDEDDIEYRTIHEHPDCKAREYMLIIFILCGSSVFILIIDIFLCCVKKSKQKE